MLYLKMYKFSKHKTCSPEMSSIRRNSKSESVWTNLHPMKKNWWKWCNDRKHSKKTDKVEHELTHKQLYEKLAKLKKEYTCHEYQVYNDIHHWPTVFSNTLEIGPIYHMDFSENLSEMHKFKSQSLHFSEAQYSLHCMVKCCSGSDSSHTNTSIIFLM